MAYKPLLDVQHLPSSGMGLKNHQGESPGWTRTEPGRASFVWKSFYSLMKSQRENIEMSNTAASRAEPLPAESGEPQWKGTGQNKPKNPKEHARAYGPCSKETLQHADFSRQVKGKQMKVFWQFCFKRAKEMETYGYLMDFSKASCEALRNPPQMRCDGDTCTAALTPSLSYSSYALLLHNKSQL